MKRFILIIISSLFISCSFNKEIYGWYIDNQSRQDIAVYFDDSKIIIDANTINYYDDIPTNPTITISETYHVNYKTSYKYNTSTHHSMQLVIKDKPKYVYKIKNNFTDKICFSLNDEIIEISSGETIEITVYDAPVTFSFKHDNFVVPFTENIENSIRWIFIYEA